MKKHINIRITGNVQGVFFRASAKRMADRLHLTGYAKNQSDGSLYIEAEGEEESLEKFIHWCKKGPSGAHVTNMKVTSSHLESFRNFITI